MSSSYLFKETVNEYLENLPAAMKSKLYCSQATCLAIYRLLPNLAKFHILSLIFNDKPVNSRIWNVWVKDNEQGKLQEYESIRRLKALSLIVEKNNHFHIHEIFRESVRSALVGNDSLDAFGHPNDEVNNKNKVAITYLDEYATRKWESILHFIVGTELDQLPSVSVLKLLQHSGLMELEGDLDNQELTSVNITQQGFQFLLQDQNAQIWTLLLEYLKMSETLTMDAVDVLNFIFMLGSLELGKDYFADSLSGTQLQMLKDLRDYGLIYQDNSNSRLFYPTRLATTLTSDSATLRSASSAMNKSIEETNDRNNETINEKKSNNEEEDSSKVDFITGTLVIETNFKLYCYATSPLQIAILNLFVHLRTRFKNLVTGQITRESIHRALRSGITSDQIIQYLEANAHPQMKRLAQEALNKKNEYESINGVKASHLSLRNLEIIPSNVVDQIKLWQLELDRIQAFDGYLFKELKTESEYNLLVNHAQDIGVLIYKNDLNRRFFVTEDGFPQIQEYLTKRAKRAKKLAAAKSATPSGTPSTSVI